MAKSGFIMDEEILRILESHAAALRGFDGATFLESPLKDVVCELIERTVRVKVHHVSSDLKEQGLREFLNYGHTLGHAIEQIEHFRWRHGNAVAVGMVFRGGAVELARVYRPRSGGLSPLAARSVGLADLMGRRHVVRRAGADAPDKKARGNMLRFVVLDRVGHVIHLENPPMEAVEEAFRRIPPVNGPHTGRYGFPMMPGCVAISLPKEEESMRKELNMARKVIVVNGPNLGRLGVREPDVYGPSGSGDAARDCTAWGEELGLEVEVRQTDDEAEMIGWMHRAVDEQTPVVMNPAAFTHYSYGLSDAAHMVTDAGLPLMEVHISNPSARDAFRKYSVISPVATGTITGMGFYGYRLALEAVAHLLEA